MFTSNLPINLKLMKEIGALNLKISLVCVSDDEKFLNHYL